MKLLIAHFGNVKHEVGHATDEEMKEIFSKFEKSLNVFVMSDDNTCAINLTRADRIDLLDVDEVEHIDVRV